MIAYGSKNNSALALDLRKAQQKTQILFSDTTGLQEIIADQIESLLLSDDLRGCSRSSHFTGTTDMCTNPMELSSGRPTQRHETNPINFAHMIELAVDEGLFLRNIIPTSDFMDGLILILTRYQADEKVAQACLKLICQLSNNDSSEDTGKSE